MLLAPLSLFSQWSWADGAGASSDQRGFAITADANGNTFVTGYIKNSGNSFGTNSISSIGGDDIFIAKYDAYGNNIWVKRAGGTDDDHGRAIALDSLGNIYVTGNFKGTATFYGSTNISLTTSNNSDVFVAKYDPSGNVLWAKRGISTQMSRGNGITVKNNLVFVTGTFSNSISFGLLPVLNTAGNEDVFITCYSAGTGFENWAVRGGGVGNDEGFAITADASGVYATGSYNNVCSFQNQAGTLPNNGSRDIYVLKYNLSGNGLWSRHAGSGGSDEGYGICVNANGVYVGGYSTGDILFYNSGPSVASLLQESGEDGILFKINPVSGDYVWAQSEYGTGNEQITGLTITPNGTLFTCGFFDGTLPFGNGPSASASTHDAFITKYDSTGVFLLGTRQSGSDDDHATGIASSGNGAAFITGYFKSTPATFGSETIYANSEDIFVAMYGCMVSQAVAGTDQVLCAEPAFLNGNTPTFGTGQWSFLSGSGLILTPFLPSTSVINLDTGMNYLTWTVTNGACVTSDTIGVILDVHPTPANAGTDQQICTTSTTLSGNAPLLGNGVWLPITGIGTIVNPLLPNSPVTGLTPGQHDFAWTISNLSCPLAIDTVSVFVDSNPSVAVAGPDQIICADSAVITGNDPAIGTGMWSFVSGSGTIADQDSSATALSNLATGMNVLQWTISNGTCPTSSDQIIVQVDAMPTVSAAGSDQLICSSSSVMTANVPSTGTGMWTLITGSGTIGNASAPNTTVSGMNTPLNVFEWTITNGVCPSSRDTITIAVDEMPTTANAGIDQTLCSFVDSLTGNTALVGIGQWSLISGSGIISNADSANCEITNLAVGANIFQWTISNGVCPPSSDQVVINVDAMPTPALVSADRQSCSLTDTISGNIPAVGTGIWTTISGSGSPDIPGAATCTASNLSVGINSFEWRISNGTCPSSADTMVIEYNEAPSVPVAGPDIFACGHYVNMQAQVPSVGTGIWESLSGNSVIADSLNPFAGTPYLDDGVWMYTWTTSNGFCISDPDTVLVHIYSPPTTAVAGTDRVIHVNEIQLNAMAPDTGIGTWSFVQGSGTFDNANDPNTHVRNLALGVNIIRWTTSNGPCAISEDEVVIDVHALIVPNGFSPNGDGTNDNFEIVGINEYPDASLQVFNRWGNVVFTSARYLNDWNGTSDRGDPLPDDTYFYILKVNEEVALTGFVTIKRTAL